jgi:uncharacterized membrane protein
MGTVAGLFEHFEDMSRAVDSLKEAGFGDEAITVLTRQGSPDQAPDSQKSLAGRGALSGGVVGGLAGLVVGLGSILVPGLGPVLAAGALATALGSAAAGAGIGAAAGGAVGALTGMGVSEEQAQLYAEGVKRGGHLVIVSFEGSQAEVVRTIFENANAVNMERAEQEWRSMGWVEFDDTVEPDAAYPRIWGAPFNQR